MLLRFYDDLSYSAFGSGIRIMEIWEDDRDQITPFVAKWQEQKTDAWAYSLAYNSNRIRLRIMAQIESAMMATTDLDARSSSVNWHNELCPTRIYYAMCRKLRPESYLGFCLDN